MTLKAVSMTTGSNLYICATCVVYVVKEVASF